MKTEKNNTLYVFYHYVIATMMTLYKNGYDGLSLGLNNYF